MTILYRVLAKLSTLPPLVTPSEVYFQSWPRTESNEVSRLNAFVTNSVLFSVTRHFFFMPVIVPKVLMHALKYAV